MKALLRKDNLAVGTVRSIGGVYGRETDKPDRVLHDGKNDVSLVFDGCERHRCDHYDHEVECLIRVSLNAQTDPNQRLCITHPVGRGRQRICRCSNT